MNGLRDQILQKSYGSGYSINRGDTKLYCDLHEAYWLNFLKKDIMGFIGKCPHCDNPRLRIEK